MIRKSFLQTMERDLKFAFLPMLKNPAFSMGIVPTIAVGI